ncbi:MAG: PadR family transcriptional regulator [Cyanobacteria bacterium P01_C01_bin.89]
MARAKRSETSSMTLAHTILVVLMGEPNSGYGIRSRFEEDVQFFWQASHQQIYRELGKMENQGWISPTVVAQEGKPDKKVYAITDSGRQELLRWCTEPTTPTAIREDLMVRILAGPYMDRGMLIEEVQDRRNFHQQRLEDCREREQWFRDHSDLPLVEKFRYLNLQRGILFEKSWVDWCDRVLELLRSPDLSTIFEES